MPNDHDSGDDTSKYDEYIWTSGNYQPANPRPSRPASPSYRPARDPDDSYYEQLYDQSDDSAVNSATPTHLLGLEPLEEVEQAALALLRAAHAGVLEGDAALRLAQQVRELLDQAEDGGVR